MNHVIAKRQEPVRTVVHLSAAVTCAALVEAQRSQQGLGEWLEGLVVHASGAGTEAQADRRLGDSMTVELFAHIASHCPGAFVGRWRLLFERCKLDPELWRYPELTVDEVESGEDCQPVLDAAALLKRWPELVAYVWLLP